MTTRKQRGQRLAFDNLDEVLRASKSSRSRGTQQFLTPREQAEALCLPLPSSRQTVVDLQCGRGALLHAAALTTPRHNCRTLLGIDIDPTAAIPDLHNPQFPVRRDVLVGDFTRLLPLLLQVKFRADLLVLNPPFSLKWKIDTLGAHRWQEINGKLELVPATQPDKVPAVDSTLATLEAAHRLLTKRGEGMMMCNAATCARLLEPHPLWRKTWLKLTLPDFFHGTVQEMKIAVVYFAANHQGKAPLELTAPDAMPATICRTLEFAAMNRDKLISGDTVRHAADSWPATERAFEAVAGEWKRQHDAEYAERNGWNIRLTTRGTISTYLTPFQTMSGDVPKQLVEALAKIANQHPAALVVQRVSRKALALVTQGNIWRVHPDVVAMVAKAMLDYNTQRAPLRPLNRVQLLGYLDEEDEIRCERPPGRGFTAGRAYPLESETFAGRKIEQRPHPRHKDQKEDVLVTGQELLLRIKDDAGDWHAFTQYPLGSEQEAARPEDHFHLLSELVECFHIPDVPDVASIHPEAFAEYQRRLRALECA